MAIMYNGKPVTIYEGDYKPINEFRNRKKVGGYNEVSLSGKSIAAEDTYNDALDLTLMGHHSQRSENAVWFNQIVEDNYPSIIGSVRCTEEINGNEIIVKVNEDISGSKYVYYRTSLTTERFIEGHIYYVQCHSKFENPNNNSVTGTISSLNINGTTNTVRIAHDSALKYTETGYKKLWILFRFGQHTGTNAYVSLNANSNTDTSLIRYLKNLMIFDLTAMFGEGKEPTADEFRKMFPCDYYPYNEGEWMYAPKGSYVKFSQLVENGNFANGFTGWKCDSGSAVVTDGMVVVKNTTDAKYIRINKKYGTKLKASHKYLLKVRGYKTAETTAVFVWFQDTSLVIPFGASVNDVYVFSNTQKDNYEMLYMGQNPWVNNNVNSEFGVTNIQVFDLTEMFGEGNEPSSVEEFKALYPEEYYEYTEGRYEDTGGFVVDGEKVPQSVDTSFVTPFPEMPEPIEHVENPKVDVTSEGVMWNQLVKNPSLQTTDFVKSAVCGAFSIKDNCLEIVPNSQGSARITIDLGKQSILNHRYYIVFTAKAVEDNIRIGSWICDRSVAWTLYKDWKRYETIQKLNIQTNEKLYNIIYLGYPSNMVTWYLKNVGVLDLTEMFGEGNEPTSVDQFKQMFPLDYYPYDSGTFRTIKSLHAITPKSNVLPFELYGANGVYDTVEPNVLVDGVRKCRVTRRWGKVDLGTLGWGKRADASPITFSVNTNGVVDYKLSNNTNFACEYYAIDGSISTSANCSKKKDLSIIYYYNKSSLTHHLYINNSHISTADELITSLQDVILHYELATPVIELYDPIDIRTLPINTIITNDSDCDMSANIKVVDKT